MRMRGIPANAPSVAHARLMQQPRAYAGEPAAVRDEQIGLIFRNMRLAMKVPRETIARRVATTSATIESFEAGAISALPHWKETARIIRAYCELLRMDPEPILWRMRELLQAPPTEVRTASTTQQAPAPRAFAPATPSERARAEAPPSGRRRSVRTLFALSAPVAAAAGVAMLVHVAPGPVYRAVGLLPEAIEWPVRAGLDYVVLATAPRREGLKWIEVGDPRLRKADKLQTSAR
jgi:transcriptional regulator with XRE-family HTH domain